MNNYIKLEYIESNGNQYIDTGISGGTNAAYSIKFDRLTIAKKYEHYFGGDQPPTGVPKLFADNSDTSLLRVEYTYNDGSTYDQRLSFPLNSVHRIDINANGYLQFDGVHQHATSQIAGRGWGPTTWWVFGHHGEPDLLSSMRLYSLKMWTNGVLVRDFIPVKNNEGVCGLYDQVENKFYSSLTDSPFISGPEKTFTEMQSNFRRRCMLNVDKGRHISEGLDFWFDGLDNQANGIYNQSAKTWYPKSDNAKVRAGYFNLVGTSAFLSRGGVSVHPTSSGNKACGAMDYNRQSPFLRLGKTYNSTIGFTIETIVDIEKTNPYSTGEEWFWGITYDNNLGASYRGGFLMESDVIKYRLYNSSYGWQSYSFGIQKIFGKQILTLVLGRNNSLSLYLNGEKVSSVDMSSGFKIPNTSYNPMTFGGYDTTGSRAIYGTFYSFKAYGRILSDREIMDSANFAKSYYKL